MFHSRYYINYGRIFNKIINNQNTVDNDVMGFLVSFMSSNDSNLDLLVRSISLLESNNMFIYSFQDKATKIIFKDILGTEKYDTNKKSIDDFNPNCNDDVIYTDFMKNYCSCKEYQAKYNRYLINDNFNNHIELKEKISLNKLLLNDEKLGVDLIGLLCYDIILYDDEVISYDFEDKKKLIEHLKKFANGDYKDIELIYTTGDLICSHLLSCNILLRNGSINIFKNKDEKVILPHSIEDNEYDDDDLQIVEENKILNFYVNTNKSVYKFHIENLNDWLYLHYNII